MAAWYMYIARAVGVSQWVDNLMLGCYELTIVDDRPAVFSHLALGALALAAIPGR